MPDMPRARATDAAAESLGIALPVGFEALEPFRSTWGRCRSQEERNRLRAASNMEQLRALHAAGTPLLDTVFERLDHFPLGSLPEAEALLYRIVLGLAEIAPAVEIFGQPNVPNSPPLGDLKIRWSSGVRESAPEGPTRSTAGAQETTSLVKRDCERKVEIKFGRG
jgi:hypothetical protein